MIYCDIDAVLIDFYGTAKKFGIELEVNKFGKWSWDKVPAEEFYAKAELQPWADNLLTAISMSFYYPNDSLILLTHDYKDIKQATLERLSSHRFEGRDSFAVKEAKNKSVYCRNPWDTLIDDNLDNVMDWRRKGGMAFWFNLEWENPCEKFLEWARLR